MKCSLFDGRRCRVIDYWSIPHFFFGTVSALFSLVFDFSFVRVFLIVFCIAFLWECFERLIGIRESFQNAFFDILLPLIAFWMTIFLVDRPFFTHEHQFAFLSISLIIYLFSNFIAWQARFSGDKEFSS